jgi:hypothetical protein
METIETLGQVQFCPVNSLILNVFNPSFACLMLLLCLLCKNQGVADDHVAAVVEC